MRYTPGRAAEQATLLDSDEWKEMVRTNGPGFRDLASKLDADDVVSLIDRLDVAPAEEQRTIISVLHGSWHEQIPMSEASKQELIARLTPLLASYPDARQPGRNAFYLMKRIALPVAEGFLMTVDPAEIPDDLFKSYIGNLWGVKSSRAMDRIRAFARLDGHRGDIARRCLKAFGFIELPELEELAANWRASKSIRYLHDLVAFYIDHQYGKPIAPVLRHLGPWNRDDHSIHSDTYWYDTVEGPGLLLISDDHVNLGGSKLK